MTMFTDLRAVPLNSELSIVLKLGTTSAESQLMHERLGHASADRLRLIGISYSPGNCHECRLGKQTRVPFRSLTLTATVKLERVYSDLCYITPVSFGMAKYFITFIDEVTRYC